MSQNVFSIVPESFTCNCMISLNILLVAVLKCLGYLYVYIRLQSLSGLSKCVNSESETV